MFTEFLYGLEVSNIRGYIFLLLATFSIFT